MNFLRLPINDVLPSVIRGLRERNAVVLGAPTGAGKTTRVPPALVDEGIAGNRQVVMLEPRRLAARAAAKRMATERNSALGHEIGYHVRHDRVAGPNTRVLVVTEGILMRMLASDPYLERISVVVLDEFHERSLDTDLALGMIRLLQSTVRPDLKLVVMSATLDTERLRAYLDDCPVVHSQGRLHPIEMFYQPRTASQPLALAIKEAVQSAMARTDGDVLAFLPGLAEIRAASRALQDWSTREQIDVVELYGDLPLERQDQALLGGPRRKVVLSTNVAETSVTVEGITAVVDSGLARQLIYDPRVGLDRLVLGPISKSSAEQRAGRAGRLRPGICIRLWDANHQRVRVAHSEPEIRRLDLAGAVLQLRALGERDIQAFPWFEAPRQESLDQATALLANLGAIHDDELTDLGRQMARLPLAPRLARLLLAGKQWQCVVEAATAAALLSERDIFRRDHAMKGPRSHTTCDLRDRIEAIQEFEDQGRTDFPMGSLSRVAAKNVIRVRDQLCKLMEREQRSGGQREQTTRGGNRATASLPEALGRSLLAAFPDRVVRRRDPHSRRGIMVGGKGVRLDDFSGLTSGELFLAVDIEGAAGDALVRQASAMERTWLPAEQLHVQIELLFDEKSRRVVARRRTRFLDIVLDDDAAALPDEEQVAHVLATAAQEHLTELLPDPESEAGKYLARIRCLREWIPELELPALEGSHFLTALRWLCHGCRSFDDLKHANWIGAIDQALTAEQRLAVQREAPERVSVPSGSRIALTYETGRPPVLAVRIQEIFGLTDTPRIARGRVKVLLHLLGPNYRPQQITDDLRSFWENGYPEIRKELRRRYPKHSWPDDPLHATPEHRPRRR